MWFQSFCDLPFMKKTNMKQIKFILMHNINCENFCKVGEKGSFKRILRRLGKASLGKTQ